MLQRKAGELTPEPPAGRIQTPIARLEAAIAESSSRSLRSDARAGMRVGIGTFSDEEAARAAGPTAPSTPLQALRASDASEIVNAAAATRTASFMDRNCSQQRDV